jgi:myo-inositol-hexaphosphate 3-phosphohydrolase
LLATLLAGALLAVGLPAKAAPQPVGDVTATVETTPVLTSGDAADDPAIWVNSDDPSQSAVIGNDKGGALEVYDPATGARIQRIAEGFFGNVDVRKGFPAAGGALDLVGVYRAGLRFYRIDPATRTLTNATDSSTGSIPAGIGGEGFCMYRSPSSGLFYAFVNARDGRVAQFELSDSDADGLVEGRQVRAWDVGSEVEGCVADDGLGHFYISEEDVGIWKYNAEPTAPTDPTTRVQVDATTAAGGRLVPDVEGLTIVYQANGAGYLIASSQAASNTNNFYAVYDRADNNAFIRTFKVVAGAATDGCGRTDGIDAVAANLGPGFPQGMFICQDNQNLAPNAGNQNFKFVPLERVVGLDAGPPENSPPLAAFSWSCTELTCDFDGTDSSDAEGAIASYQWSFGDERTADESEPTHSFAEAGTYAVTLDVTDADGATGTVRHEVTVTDSISPLSFRARARFVGNTTNAPLTVPSSVQAGDGLILFATLNNTATTVTGPLGVTGWTPVENVVTNTSRTMVWKKVATAGDAGGTMRLQLSNVTKVTLNLVAYGGTSTTDPVATFATRSETTAVTSHPTPTVTVTDPRSWLLSYWADKSSTTTDWTAPAGIEVRDETIGSGSRRITTLVADSGAGVPIGTAGGLIATTNAASRATTMSIVLAPTS